LLRLSRALAILLFLLLLLLRSLVNGRGLIPLLLAVIRLLIITLLVPTGGRRRISPLLLVGGPLLRSLIALWSVIASQIFGRVRFAHDVSNRPRGEVPAGRALDWFHARTAIDENCPLTAAEVH